MRCQPAVRERADARQFTKAQMLIEAIGAHVQRAQAKVGAGRAEAAERLQILFDHAPAITAALAAFQ